ncbi:DUF6958 family protein [Chryseolinea lacunae]|uniref:MarR family transcriptional regulator n=1 Tax=Chryseolinea lacunae TaxID=2801331 RepID=A0ABS1L1W8_9BACT|nr:hypothetical protein [Chryseolinea lacunae]MBL0745438.1 hypothetical protein [Chryseolinea lacunae]
MENTSKREEVFRTLRADRREGVLLVKEEYDALSSFILSTIEKAEGLSLHDLLEKAHQEIGSRLEGDLAWKILQVKMDLEARGFLEIVTPTRKRHAFTIKLTRQGLSKIRYENQVAEWAVNDL